MHRIPFRIIKNFPASLILQNIRRQFPDRQKYWRAEEAVLTKIRELVVMLIDEEYGRCGEDDLNSLHF